MVMINHGVSKNNKSTKKQKQEKGNFVNMCVCHMRVSNTKKQLLVWNRRGTDRQSTSRSQEMCVE